MKRLKGEITVFFAMILTILLSVLFQVIEAARSNAVQFQTECAADAALQSALAEYNKELLSQYDLLFIETGYGMEENGYILLEEHLKSYLQDNLRTEEGRYGQRLRDLLQIEAETVTVTKACGAADGDGNVLMRRAAEYMLQKNGRIDFSEWLTYTGQTKEQGLLEDKIERKRRKNETAIASVDTTVTGKDGKKKKIAIHNPADKVNSRRNTTGILNLITGGEKISDQAAVLTDYISHRGYKEKDGFLSLEEEKLAGEELLFQKYMMEKCGNYVHRKENSYLAYEMEYVLGGKSSDYENLKSVTERLLLLREGANFLYLLKDSAKQAEAEALAVTLTAVLLFPELKDLIKLSILIAWAYAESVNDVHTLLSGGNVPLFKESHTWQMDLTDAMSMNLKENSGGGNKGLSDNGLSYETYLHILLALMEKSERNLRFLDVMEMDVRKTEGNGYFRIDRCIDAFTAEMLTASAKGHSCLIKREAAYWK